MKTERQIERRAEINSLRAEVVKAYFKYYYSIISYYFKLLVKTIFFALGIISSALICIYLIYILYQVVSNFLISLIKIVWPY